MDKTKVCKKCGKELPIEKFVPYKYRGSLYYRNQCKGCRNILLAKRREKTPLTERREYIKTLTPEQRIIEQKQHSKQYRDSHKEYYKEHNKKWREENNQRRKEYSKKYYDENKESLSQQTKKYYIENKEKRHEYSKKWYKENKETINERRNRDEAIIKRRSTYNARIKTDINFKLTQRLRDRVRDAIKDNKKGYHHSIDLLGCSVTEARKHIERQFQPGMSWDNYGQFGWHIDHIIPCASFDFTDYEQQKKCFHYTNLQPLWWRDNIIKGDKIETKQLMIA